MSKENEEKKATIFLMRALPEHADLVVPLFQAYSEFYGWSVSAEQVKAYIDDGLAQGDAVIFLAVQQFDHVEMIQPVGFIQLHPSRSPKLLARRWIVNDLYVVPDVRRSGIGRKLLEAAKEFAQVTNAKDMVLRTARTNRAAQALYKSLDWVADEEFVTYQLHL